jgi:hypothetical protein
VGGEVAGRELRGFDGSPPYSVSGQKFYRIYSVGI